MSLEKVFGSYPRAIQAHTVHEQGVVRDTAINHCPVGSKLKELNSSIRRPRRFEVEDHQVSQGKY